MGLFYTIAPRPSTAPPFDRFAIIVIKVLIFRICTNIIGVYVERLLCFFLAKNDTPCYDCFVANDTGEKDPVKHNQGEEVHGQKNKRIDRR